MELIQVSSDVLWIHLATVIPIVFFKVAVLFVGYLIAKLGYELLVKGITGQFKFSASFKGATADLVSVSPGVFFILMATVMISFAILKDKPFSTKFTGTSKPTAGISKKDVSIDEQGKKPILPDKPPTERRRDEE